MGIAIESITNAINVIQSNPIAFHSISAALQMIPVAGAVLGKYWDKYKDSKEGVPTKDLLRALEAMKNMNQEQFENFSKKLEESNDRATLNYLILQKIDLQQGELSEQLAVTETSVIAEIQTVGSDVQAMFEEMKQMKEQMMLLVTQKGITTIIDTDKKIEISDDELIKFKQQGEEIEKLKEELAKVNQRPLFDSDFVMKEANIYYYAGEHEKAISLYDLILKYDEKNINALYNKGVFLRSQNKYSEMIEWFDKILKLNPKHPGSLRNKSFALAMLDRKEEELLVLDKEIEINPKDCWLFQRKYRVLIELDRWEEAEECEDKRNELDPAFFGVLRDGETGVLIEDSVKEAEERIKFLNIELEKNHNDVDLLIDKGAYLSGLERYDEAIECYDKVLGLDQKYLDELHYKVAYDIHLTILKDKCKALKNTKRYDEIILCCDQIFKRDSKEIYFLTEKANALFLLERYDDAIECLDKVLEADKKNTGALSGKAIIFTHLKRYDDAIEYFDRILQIEPMNQYSLYSRGYLTEIHLKLYAEAIEYFNRILKQSRDGWFDARDKTDYQNRYDSALYSKACCMSLLCRSKEAIECLKNAIELDPKYKELAKTDDDFQNIANEELLKELLK